jgi:hypothetical protein
VSDLGQFEVSWQREATPIYPARLGDTQNLKLNYLKVYKVSDLLIPRKLRIRRRDLETLIFRDLLTH